MHVHKYKRVCTRRCTAHLCAHTSHAHTLPVPRLSVVISPRCVVRVCQSWRATEATPLLSVSSVAWASALRCVDSPPPRPQTLLQFLSPSSWGTLSWSCSPAWGVVSCRAVIAASPHPGSPAPPSPPRLVRPRPLSCPAPPGWATPSSSPQPAPQEAPGRVCVVSWEDPAVPERSVFKVWWFGLTNLGWK